MLTSSTQENGSLLPGQDELSDETGQGYRSFKRYPRQATYCSFQEGQDVESAEVLSTSLLVGEHNNENIGLLMMLLSAFGFSLNGLMVKFSGYYFPASTIVLARSVLQAIFGIVACCFLKIPPLGPSHRRRLLVARGIFGAVGLALYYYALTVLPIADATVLFFTGPVFTSILAHFWLGEDFNYLDALTSLLCFAGVILTARPPFLFGASHPAGLPIVANQTKGAAYALMGAIFSACAYVTVRKIGSEVHFLQHVVSFGIASTFFSGLMVGFGPTSTGKSLADLGFNHQTLLLLLVGLTAILGQCLLNRGLQLCRAGPATLMRNIDVVFAYLYGIFIFAEIPSYYSMIGSILIITCTLSMGIRKWIA